jgi:hypothetical protein
VITYQIEHIVEVIKNGKFEENMNDKLNTTIIIILITEETQISHSQPLQTSIFLVPAAYKRGLVKHTNQKQ